MKKLTLVMVTLLCSLMASAWTVYFQKPTGWDTVRIWAWPGSITVEWGDRPEMTKVNGTDDIYEYTAETSTPEGIQFSNSDKSQSCEWASGYKDGWLYDTTGPVKEYNGGGDTPVVTGKVTICGSTYGWGDGTAFEYDEAIKVFVFTADFTKGEEFKLKYNGGWVENMNLGANAQGYFEQRGSNWTPKDNFTAITLVYTPDNKTLDVRVPEEPEVIRLCGEGLGWGEDATAMNYDEATDTWSYTVASVAAGSMFKLYSNKYAYDNGYMYLNPDPKPGYVVLVDGGTDHGNIKFNEACTDATFTYKGGKLSITATQHTTPSGDITKGTYAFGEKLFLHYRNDADTSKPFEEVEVPFEAWNEETGNGLELFVYRFRANSRDVAFYLTNEKGEVICDKQEMEVEHFYTYLTPGAVDEEYYNHFTGLVLGEDYRVIVKADKKKEDGTYNRSFIGVFPVITEYPWGANPEGLRLHSNLENGTWPGTGDIPGLNVSEGPDLLYNENTKIWYVDFTLGEAGELNNGQGQGWEFTLTDKFGINWYKKDLEIIPGDWQDGAMDLQTANNDRNFYIRKEAAGAAGIEPGMACRMQIRHNEATGKWQVRFIEKPVFSGDLYIASPDINAESAPVLMQKANDVQGHPIEGMYVYTMKYTAGAGFRVSTANGDAFLEHQLTMALNNETADAAELATPYSYCDQNNENAAAWTVAGDPQMVSVVVNYNTGTLRVYSPSVEIAFENRRVLKMPGKFDAEERGVAVADVTNKVKGATDRDPVVFTRMNHITADVTVTHRYFDDECTLTINGLTINGLAVGNMEGITVKGSENIDELTNHLSYLPYAGHLELGDGDPEAHYDIELSYTVTRGDLAKADVAKITYTPNFQPYFVRPRPVTDDDQSLKVKKGYVGDDFKALAVRTVKFAGNTFDGVYHDYKGEGNPDNARVAVYPGFTVQTDAEQPEGHHIPMGTDWATSAGNADYYLAGYTVGGDMDWSTAALMEGKLPVFVNTNCTSVDENPAVTYEIYAHYPLYSINGGVRVPASEHDLGFESGDRNRVAARAAVEGAKVSTIVQYRTYDNPEFDQETTGVESVAADMTSAGDAEYFNLQGVRVAAPEKGCIYIVRQGNKVAKVRF